VFGILHRAYNAGTQLEGELMHFGISMFPTDYAIRPDELARALEERGFESLCVFGVKPDRAAIDHLAGAGVDRTVFMVPSDTREKVRPRLDAYAAVSR
jgi:hypothetical protein